MAKFDNRIIYFIIGIVALLIIIFYGGQQGWFKSDTSLIIPNQSLAQFSNCNQLCKGLNLLDGYTASSVDKCQPGEMFYSYGYPDEVPILSCCCRKSTIIPGCSVSVDKSVINEGEEVIGTIKDGANTKCEIFMNKDNAGWIKAEEGITDANGVLRITNSLMAGVYQFYAKCGTCTTNTLTVTSNAKATTYRCCTSRTGSTCRTTRCLIGEREEMLFNSLIDCSKKCGKTQCSDIFATSQADCDEGNCDSGNICTYVKGSDYCSCKLPNDFCSQSCTNSYFPGGRGPVSDLSSCNLQVENPFIQGYSGGTAICCCNHFDIIGCGRYGGSFGYTRNSLIMPESTLNYCSEVAFMDCQSTGKTVKNYNLVSTCCMWNCN